MLYFAENVTGKCYNSADYDSGYGNTAKSFSRDHLSTSLSSCYTKSLEGSLSVASDDILKSCDSLSSDE